MGGVELKSLGDRELARLATASPTAAVPGGSLGTAWGHVPHELSCGMGLRIRADSAQDSS